MTSAKCFLSCLELYLTGNRGIKNPDTRSFFRRGTYIGGACTKNTGTQNTYSTRAVYIKNISIGDICGLIHKASKSSIGCSRLLIDSISEILVSACFHLRDILDKTIDYCSTYWI